MNAQTQRLSRRRLVTLLGSAGAVTIAGCLDNDDTDDTNGTDTGNDDPDMGAVEEHLEDANGWDGETQDHTGEDSITINVGDPDGGGDYRFEPVAPEIDVGTQVTWEWVDDSQHSVTDEEGEFDSEVQEDATFDHTFDEEGTYLYHCQPHRAQGHLGAIIVHE